MITKFPQQTPSAYAESWPIKCIILTMCGVLLLRPTACTPIFNASACESFHYRGVYFHLNYKNLDQNILTQEEDLGAQLEYNLCRQVEYYCEATHRVVVGSLVAVYGKDQGEWNRECHAYEQHQIGLVGPEDVGSGILVTYKIKKPGQVNALKGISQFISISFPCADKPDQNGVKPVSISGCPNVEESIIFDYLSRQQVPFTICCQVLGILLMVLGVYVYRVSIVLIGAFSLFVILLFLEAPIVFQRGISDDTLSNVLILTAICSFFGGYVAAYFSKIGLFVLGAWLGIILSLTLNNIAFYYIESKPANLTLWIVMPILAIGFGMLGLFIKRTFIIFATSLIGPYLCLRALSWHLGAFPNEFLLARNYQLGLVGAVQWQFYLYLVSLLILTASSSALQCWLFSKQRERQGGREDLDERFMKLEEDLVAKRANLVEFENIFKKKEPHSPPIKIQKGSSRQFNIEMAEVEKSEASQGTPGLSQQENRIKVMKL